jgi:hypothetical protein
MVEDPKIYAMSIYPGNCLRIARWTQRVSDRSVQIPQEV